MAFLSNHNINYLNIHVALVNLLDQSFTIFSPIYLYQQGFSLPAIFALMAFLNLLRLPFRFLSFPIVKRIGLKAGVMIGAAGYGLTFPILSMVHGVGGWLVLYVFTFSVFNALHWHCYHTFYSIAGEREKRGRQVAVAQALSVAFMAIAPVLSALFLNQTDFQHYFMLAFVMIALMCLTLSFTRNIPISPAPWSKGKKEWKNLGAQIHLADSATMYPLQFAWIFVVYLYVQKLVWLGGIVTFGIVIQLAYQLLLGSWLDRGHGSKITHAAGVFRVLQILGKALLPLSMPVILGLEATSAAGSVHYTGSQPIAMYNAGKQSNEPFWYWLFAESAFDIGTVIGGWSAAALLWYGVPLRFVILLALPPVLLLWWILNHYFKGHSHDRAKT